MRHALRPGLRLAEPDRVALAREVERLEDATIELATRLDAQGYRARADVVLEVHTAWMEASEDDRRVLQEDLTWPERASELGKLFAGLVRLGTYEAGIDLWESMEPHCEQSVRRTPAGGIELTAHLDDDATRRLLVLTLQPPDASAPSWAELPRLGERIQPLNREFVRALRALAGLVLELAKTA